MREGCRNSIKIWAELSFVLSQITQLRHGRTDRRAVFSWIQRGMQRGKTELNLIKLLQK